MVRFLVRYATGRKPPIGSYVIHAPTRESIVADYPFFADSPILELPSEQPDWLTDAQLETLEHVLSHTLGRSRRNRSQLM